MKVWHFKIIYYYTKLRHCYTVAVTMYQVQTLPWSPLWNLRKVKLFQPGEQ